ncbi:hypothetical protein BLD44_015260 [Mastigocladus laminosus UU774]|nr:hypothetical protein B4U84_01235 [Westiellopsis prolifica IICB1]TFI53501.1 hypothetical protein BLD44_015260 [Mastigocladus laminosus UU774]
MYGFQLYFVTFILAILVVVDGILSATGLVNILQANNLFTYILAVGMGIFITGMSLMHKMLDYKPIGLKMLIYLGIMLDALTTIIATHNLVGSSTNSELSNLISGVVGITGGIVLTSTTIYTGDFIDDYWN